jgi:type I restriction enzyme M protein
MHDSEGNLLLVNDIPQNLGFDDFIEGTVTHNYSDRTSKSFLIPKADIVANDYDLSINRYKEVVYEEVVYEKPNTLIQDIKALQADNAKKLLDLEKMLEK